MVPTVTELVQVVNDEDSLGLCSFVGIPVNTGHYVNKADWIRDGVWDVRGDLGGGVH